MDGLEDDLPGGVDRDGRRAQTPPLSADVADGRRLNAGRGQTELGGDGRQPEDDISVSVLVAAPLESAKYGSPWIGDLAAGFRDAIRGGAVMHPLAALREPGVRAALAAAVLFGAAAPVAKVLLDGVGPWMLAGLLYAGAGLGLWVWRRFRRAPAVRLAAGDWRWLAGAVVAGGVVAPVLLLVGLSGMPASGASLLLNAESVFTALLAWVVFRENVDRRVAVGMLAIAAGAVVLSWPAGGAGLGSAWPALAVLAACALWALDNNLARRVSYADAAWLAMVKGLVAGSVNLLLALLVAGEAVPPAGLAGAAMVTGFAAYGVSLSLFVYGLRTLGTARTGAYFAVAPFFGAVLAVVLLGEAVTGRLAVAGALMAVGVWLHLTERHRHPHRHAALLHAHAYDSADPHHEGAEPVDGDPLLHRHPGLLHDHPHYPDLHHRHDH